MIRLLLVTGVVLLLVALVVLRWLAGRERGAQYDYLMGCYR